MSKRKEKILGELGFTYAGLSGKTQKDFGRGKPFIPFMNIMSNGKIDPKFMGLVDVAPNERQNAVQEGDLFFTTSSETPEEVGMTSVLLEDIGECYLNSFCFGFRLYNFDDLKPEFAPYLFRGNDVRKQIINLGQGYTRFNLPKTELLKKLTLSLPSENEQKIIAEILTKADSIIEKTQAAIAKYKAIKQGMLQDLFTRGIDLNTNKLRPRYQDAPTLYKETKLGWIPKEWEEIPLEELTTQIGDGIHTTPKYSQNTYFYFINGNNLVNGEIQIGSALCVSEDEFEKYFKKLDERTILYSINGTIGNIAFYKNEQVIIGKSVCYISCKQSVVLDYIYFLLQTFQVSKFYELELTASTIRNLSLASVRSTPITIPKDEAEQNLISERIKAIDNKLQTEQAYLQKMQMVKKGLMEDLLSGKKQVLIKNEIA